MLVIVNRQMESELGEQADQIVRLEQEKHASERQHAAVVQVIPDRALYLLQSLLPPFSRRSSYYATQHPFIENTRV